jgi:MFS family permease
MNMQIIARGWFVYDLTSSAMDLAWVTLSFMLPSVLFSLYGGVLADRLPKRRLIVFAQSLNALATLIMAWIIFSGTVVFWDFIWFGFFNGTILALSMPARQAFVPEVIPQPLIFTAMALNTTGWNLSRIVGPALAGLLIAWLAGGDKQSAFGVGVVYVVIAALYLFSALTMLLVDLPGKSSQIQSSGTYNEMREGLAYVFAHPRIFALLLMSIIPFLFGMPLNTLLPAFNQDVLGGHADSLGILVSAMGGGAIVGSMMMATMGDMKRKGLWLLISSLGWAGATAAFGIGSSVAWALLAIALIGLVSAWNMSLNRGLLQHTVDAHMRGRIMSIDMMFHGLMPIGVFPISWVAEAYGVGTALTVSGIAFGAMVVLSYLLSPAVRGMAADAPTSLKAAS